MAVREYIGARYVPIFADPLQWDPDTVYEPLTVVTDQGASYVSRQSVPTGVQLNNTDYWILWADYNAQLQHYIDEVQTFDGRIDDLEDAMPISNYSSASTVKDAIDDLGALLPESAFTSVNTVKAAIDKTNAKKTKFLLIADSWGSEAYVGHSKAWATLVGNQLGLTCINKSVGGAGFVSHQVGSEYFENMIDNAIADTSIVKDELAFIILLGGLNDYSLASNPFAMRNAVQTCITKLQAGFAGVPIYFFPLELNWSSSRLMDNTARMMLGYMTALLTLNTSNVTILSDTPFIFANRQFGYYIDSGTGHPNEVGNRRLAQCVINALNGVELIPREYLTYFPSTYQGVTCVSSVSMNKSYYDGSGLHVYVKLVLAPDTYAAGTYRLCDLKDFQYATDTDEANYMRVESTEQVRVPLQPENVGLASKVSMLTINSDGSLLMHVTDTLTITGTYTLTVNGCRNN